jgi:hypothetical protein
MVWYIAGMNGDDVDCIVRQRLCSAPATLRHRPRRAYHPKLAGWHEMLIAPSRSVAVAPNGIERRRR